MPQTKRGIYHNLKESKYTISNSEIVYFFSSKLYMDKFLVGYKSYREKFMQKVLHFDSPLNMEILADIEFYKLTEKRGFRVLHKGVDISCDDIYLYALQKMTQKNTKDWCVVQKPKLEERIKSMV